MRIRTLAAVTFALFVGTTLASAASKDDAVAMVKKTVAVIKTDGAEKAYAAINTPGSAYQNGEVYVVVLGAGASAIDLAALLHDSGASVKIVARNHTIRYHAPPGPNDSKWWHQLRSPASTIGPGWRSYAAVKLPFLFRFLPESMRLRVVKRHLGPAPGRTQHRTRRSTP